MKTDKECTACLAGLLVLAPAVGLAACEDQEAEHQRLVARKEYWSALGVLFDCAAQAGDPRLLELIRETEALAKQQAEDASKEMKAREQRYREEQERAQELQRRTVRLGMTQRQVLQKGWGPPQRINRTTTGHGTFEQWVYGDGNYLYFRNGILTAIQN